MSKESLDEPQNVKLAGDSIIFGFSADSLKIGDAQLDPITKAVREEILMKQLNILKEAYKQHGKEEAVKGYDDEEFKKYLRSEQGQLELAELSKKPETEKALNEIEVAGYKAVHSRFAENFKDVDWKNDVASDIKRSTEVTGPNGDKIVTIVETTHNTSPASVTLSNGTTKQISSYRTIDFPQKLDSGKGPMHVSMAVKDANGNNIEENKAVYFTAHYDKAGKLTEVSSPQPVKFAGEGNDAVAYIERGGEVYTLAVTKGKYMEMIQEVTKNQEVGVDRSAAKVEPAVEPAVVAPAQAIQPIAQGEPAVEPAVEPIVVAPPVNRPLEAAAPANNSPEAPAPANNPPEAPAHARKALNPKELTSAKQSNLVTERDLLEQGSGSLDADRTKNLKEAAQKLADGISSISKMETQQNQELASIENLKDRRTGSPIGQSAVEGATENGSFSITAPKPIEGNTGKSGVAFAAAAKKMSEDMTALRAALGDAASKPLQIEQVAKDFNDNSKSPDEVKAIIKQHNLKDSDLKNVYDQAMNNAISEKDAPMALIAAKNMDSLYQNMSQEKQKSVKHKENLDATKLMKSPPGSSKDKEQDAMKKASSIQNKLSERSDKASTSHAVQYAASRSKNKDNVRSH